MTPPRRGSTIRTKSGLNSTSIKLVVCIEGTGKCVLVALMALAPNRFWSTELPIIQEFGPWHRRYWDHLSNLPEEFGASTRSFQNRQRRIGLWVHTVTIWQHNYRQWFLPTMFRHTPVVSLSGPVPILDFTYVGTMSTPVTSQMKTGSASPSAGSSVERYDSS